MRAVTTACRNDQSVYTFVSQYADLVDLQLIIVAVIIQYGLIPMLTHILLKRLNDGRKKRVRNVRKNTANRMSYAGFQTACHRITLIRKLIYSFFNTNSVVFRYVFPVQISRYRGSRLTSPIHTGWPVWATQLVILVPGLRGLVFPIIPRSNSEASNAFALIAVRFSRPLSFSTR